MVAVATAIALFLRAFLLAPYYIPSASMEPTLHGCPRCDNDHVLVFKAEYDLHPVRRDDIVVFNRPETWQAIPEKTLIKRVIGVGGDRLRIAGGQVFVNGQHLDESFVNNKCVGGTLPERGSTASYGPIRKGYVFVMGDNRCNSDDSRHYGPVPEKDIVGKAVLIIWPFGRIGTL